LIKGAALVHSETPIRSSFVRFLAVLAVLAASLVAPPAVAPVSAQEVRDILLPVPVETVGSRTDGGVYWSDTYGACRSGCSRSHQGVDMLGPKLTPLLAVADGYISWMRHDSGRGNNLVLTDDDGWEYHYIHINNDSPGTDDGANPIEHAFAARIAEAWTAGEWRNLRVSKGELVAFMGDSGNAEACCSHLHFEIVNPDGANINPTPSVDAALAFGLAFPQGITVDPSLLGPYETLRSFEQDLYGTLVGRSASTADVLELRASLEADGFSASIVPFIDVDSQSADIDRLYVAYFNRLPDYEGYTFWHGRLNEGWNILRASRYFSESPEYQATYGDAGFDEFLDILYQEVLGRAPDLTGKAFWLDALENDPRVDRATIVAFFTDSIELRGMTEQRSEIVALTALFSERMPTDAEIESWQSLRATLSLEDAIAERFDPQS
jgi:hypothetical protein